MENVEGVKKNVKGKRAGMGGGMVSRSSFVV